MHRVVRQWACVWSLLVVLAACGTPPTQLVVAVDTDLELGSEIDRIAVSVTGPSGQTETEATALGPGDRASLPLTLGISPSGDELGPIEIRAVASRSGTEVVAREHRVRLVRGETRVLAIHLMRACAARGPCPTGQTCGEQGCVDVELRSDQLPRWGGEPPRLDGDAGTPDAGIPDDGGPPSDGGTRPDAGPQDCVRDADCDDGEACTIDTCADGVCAHAPDDGAACDDGLFCNGLDTCQNGACTVHAGSPCVGSTVCDENGDRCTGCTSDADCPDESVGAWGSCAFDEVCDDTGSQSRIVRSFECLAGACVPTDRIETQTCSRRMSAEGTVCAAARCEPWSDCGGFDGTCGENGVETRTCTVGECSSGDCTLRTYNETRPCTRETDGTSCGTTPVCTDWDPCTYPTPCARSGSQTRTCGPPVCVDGVCSTGTPYTETRACTRETEGAKCGDTECPAWGPCAGPGCSTSGSQSRVCVEHECRAEVCEMNLRPETRSCTRLTDGLPCDDGLSCTQGDQCRGGICRRGLDICGANCQCTVGGCMSTNGMYFCIIPDDPIEL